MAVFTREFADPGGDGPRLAVKCSIDVAGEVSTSGSPALAERTPPAARDAAVVATARTAGARIVGHTVMPELGITATGVNPWYGTPDNPLDPSLLPGGSSTGSTVAVVLGLADVAYGTDAGGSLRIPPACCGATGLKPTFGRLPLDGVWALAPSLDVVGPIGRDVAAVALGMGLMEPGFEPGEVPPARVARARPPADAGVDAAVDRALTAAGFEVVEVDLPDLEDAYRGAAYVLLAEAWETSGHLLADRDRLSPDIAAKLEFARYVTPAQLEEAAAVRQRFSAALAEVFAAGAIVALPTLPSAPPPRAAPLLEADVLLSRLTLPFNLTGHPVLALPVPRADHPLPASLQLVGPHGAEEVLLAAGAAF